MRMTTLDLGLAPVLDARKVNSRLERELAPDLAAAQAIAAAERILRAAGLRPMAGEAAGIWTFTHHARRGLLVDNTFDFDTDTFKMALFLSTSNLSVSSTTYPATNEHANANGYTTGGVTVSPLSVSAAAAVITVDGADGVWNASGGSIVARFAAIYKDSGTDTFVCFCLLDSTPADVTVTTGNTLTVAINPTGIYTLSGG